MALPYSEARSGKNALTEMQKTLQAFGCKKFCSGEDFETGELFIQFEHNGRMVNLSISAKGYAAAWLRENPYNSRRQCSEKQHQAKALEIGTNAIYSIARDWIKAQITMIEVNALSFEGAFLSNLMLPSGMTVLEHIEKQNLLPSPEIN